MDNPQPYTGRDESSSRKSCDLARRSGTAAVRAADLEQLQAECFELVDYAVRFNGTKAGSVRGGEFGSS
jgi:hypothetical protein